MSAHRGDNLNRFLPSYLLLLSALTAAADTVGSLRVEPHTYPSAVGYNPAFQMVTNGRLRWFEQKKWEVELHVEAETQGRRDVLFDIDRAWYAIRLDDDFTALLGRVHPFDVSHHHDRYRPWGLVSSRQSQDRGLLLGSGRRDLNATSQIIGTISQSQPYQQHPFPRLPWASTEMHGNRIRLVAVVAN